MGRYAISTTDGSVIDKTEFYTATPVNKNGIVMYDRDNPENSDCGPIAYEYLYYQALIDNISRKYDVCLNLCLRSPETKKKYEYVFETIIRHCLSVEYDYWNILTFHSGVNETDFNLNSVVKEFSNKSNIKLFKDLFVKIQNEEYPMTKSKFNVNNIIFKGIHAGTKNRQDIIQDFDRKVPSRIYVLSSCRTIGEGIDTKWANMEVPVDPTKSFIQESQKIGRITRRPEDGMPNSILAIPVCIEPQKYMNAKTPEEKDEVIRQELAENGDFSTFLNVVSAFKYQYDPDLYEMCLRYPNMFSPQEVKDNLEKQGLKVEESQGNLVDNIKYLIKDDSIDLDNCIDDQEDKTLENIAIRINRPIEVFTQDLDNPIEYYNQNCDEEPIYLFRDENNVYSPITFKTKKCSRSIRSIRPPINKRQKLFNVHTHPDLQVLWKIDESSLSKCLEGQFCKGVLDVSISWNIKCWYETLDKVKYFMDTEQKRPNKRSKNQEEIFLGCWIGTQLKNYKKKRYIMKDENIRKTWEEFITDPKYCDYFKSDEKKWYETIDKVKSFMDTHKNRPKDGSTNKDEKVLGSWISHQLRNYKKKTQIMKDEKIRTSWEAFVNNPKYRDYLKSFVKRWYDTLDKVKSFIDTHHKRPSQGSKNQDEKVLGQWIVTQVMNHKKDKMNQKRKTAWEVFMSKYCYYFKSNEEQWYETLEKVSSFIDTHHKRPYDKNKNQDEKKLGKWISHQITNYKKKTHNMKNEKLRTAWEAFINDPKYCDYFKSLEDIWYKILDKVSSFIDTHHKRPSHGSKNPDEKVLGSWISIQLKNYKKNKMDQKRKTAWEVFVSKYCDYFKSNEEQWYETLKKVKSFIDTQKKRPSSTNKNTEEKALCQWVSDQIKNYKKKRYIMKDENIKTVWEEFVNDPKYFKYFKKRSKKSVIVKPKTKSNNKSNIVRQKSKYQEISRKMSSQNSTNTNKMFQDNNELWHLYHNYRDYNFEGYDNQDEIPVNRIISYLESKSTRKLKILDLGCGRNHIYEHFKQNKNVSITGYDHISYNDSVVCDISNLPEEDESINICVYSQSLMGSNWKEYLNEGKRVLNYNGEMIISESIDRYDVIKAYIQELGLFIKNDDYDETKRWFYIYAINE